MILATPAAEVKPATFADVFPLAFRDEYQALEADARDTADEPTDEEWDRMAEESAYMDMLEAGLCPF